MKFPIKVDVLFDGEAGTNPEIHIHPVSIGYYEAMRRAAIRKLYADMNAYLMTPDPTAKGEGIGGA